MYPRKRAIFYFFWLLFWLNAFFVNEFYDFKTGNNTGKVVNFLNERQIIVGFIPISVEPDRSDCVWLRMYCMKPYYSNPICYRYWKAFNDNFSK